MKLYLERFSRLGYTDFANERRARAQDARCRRGEHIWVRSDERPECGCPSDPGIHGCGYLAVCLHCDEYGDNYEEDE